MKTRGAAAAVFTILVCMCPLLTAVVARFVFPGNRLHPLFFLGFAIAVTVVFAYLFLGEELTAVSATGAGLILAGVVISGWKRI